MLRLLFIFLFFLSILSVNSQSNSISGTISGLENQNVYLMRQMGERKTTVDTAITDLTGSFIFHMPESRSAGIYLIISGPGKAVELIYNYEDIQFTTSEVENVDAIQIISSVENLIYYDYLSLKTDNLYKIKVLDAFIQSYPPNDKFYMEAINQYDFLRKQLNDRVDKLTTDNSLSIAAKFISTDRPIIPDPTLNALEKDDYLKTHFFDNVDFSDSMLINSTVLTSKIVGYLSLNQKYAKSQEELEDLMLISIDTILKYTSSNQQVYEHVVDFLISGFESIGFERGLEYIANANTLNDFCENTEQKLNLQEKLELIKKLAIGQPAPEFKVKDINGIEIDLYAIEAETTVIVFWASWCQHCDEILPIINNYYQKGNKSEVIAISIDDNEEVIKEWLSQNDFNWINIAELKGWHGAIIEEYGIVATPTVLVLDRDKKILAKPVRKENLERILSSR
ncbi:MAG: hypothetical protein CMF58_03495 [Lentimicrobiaceae bacterium]|nr:hypothetical protein [Lentimicrobiaceae bacterium]MDG1901630.1 redoxin domain-containing protein [Bacteroidales bacterium]